MSESTSAKDRPLTVREGSSMPESQVLAACYFLSVELENVRGFKTPQRLSLELADGQPARWTVLLGDNGLGKTTVLQCLSGMRLEVRMKEEAGELTENVLPRIFTSSDLEHAFPRVARDNFSIKVRIRYVDRLEHEGEGQKATVTYLRTGLPEGLEGKRTSTVTVGARPFTAYGYGALRRLGNGSLEDTRDPETCVTLFDDEKPLLNAEEWLREADYAAAKSGEPKAGERLARIVDLLKQFLPDVEDIRIEARGARVPIPEAKTPFGWVPVRALSTGYRSVVAWVVDFASRLLDRYADDPNPFHGSAIVLVDQIDLHLHPKWQREMMYRLTSLFPNTQFIVTAHSPLIVQAIPNANLALLRRVGDEVHILNRPEDIHGWRTDQLLASELFDFQKTRDDATEALLAERRHLLEKHPRTEEEEARLTELERQAAGVPQAESAWDIEAMKLIRDAAKALPAK